MKVTVGQGVHVKGEHYRVVDIRPAGEGKFFGRYVFVLVADDGTMWRGYGKQLAHNSKLIPGS